MRMCRMDGDDSRETGAVQVKSKASCEWAMIGNYSLEQSGEWAMIRDYSLEQSK